ncbi:hypothetical protein EB061_07215 [bacterium]|jgi:biopolymer transport protein ExbD|nr:hypothetical protein [bacterium]
MTGKRRLFQKKATPASPQILLQITSMADVFTILLVFLLKGIANNSLAIIPAPETRLPSALHTRPLAEDVLQVEISRTGILVNKDFVTMDPDFEKALSKRLQIERSRGTKDDLRAILLADTSIPFSKLKIAMKALSRNGYSSIHFGATAP